MRAILTAIFIFRTWPEFPPERPKFPHMENSPLVGNHWLVFLSATRYYPGVAIPHPLVGGTGRRADSEKGFCLLVIAAKCCLSMWTGEQTFGAANMPERRWCE